VLAGHNHRHRVCRHPHGVQVSTASLIEWPMECRIVEIDRARVRSVVLPSAAPYAAGRSLVAARWPAGGVEDREFVSALPVAGARPS
jgi:hypothetical protein